MEEYKVLITTSGLGSRLGELTDYTNKCLIRISDKPSISYIIESYPKNVNFVITLGHYGSHVKQFLTLAYPDRNFTYVEIDKFKGPGSSLGYSIFKCKDVLKCPFIFHASDTIVKDFTLPDLSTNWVVGSYKENVSQYRTILTKNKFVEKINEKGELNYVDPYIGLSGIKDYELFFKELETLLLNEEYDISDVHVINRMLETVKFEYKEVKKGNWFDVGNTTELTITRNSFESNIEVLDKKDESIFFFDDFVIKFFADETINKNRIHRAEKLKGLVPELLDYSKNFYKYRKAEGHLFSKSVNSIKFNNFLNWTQKNLWIDKSHSSFYDNCYNFYVKKTKQRVIQYLKSENDIEETINGIKVPSVFEVLNSIDNSWLCNGIASQYHGDFILDNIIETNDGFCLIDWRQDFSGDLEIGDRYYDLAKLNHNLIINHEIVNHNLFFYNNNECYIYLNSKLIECQKILHKFILDNNYDLNKVEVLSSIIWLNMASLHEYPFNHFLFKFGKYNLYKHINK